MTEHHAMIYCGFKFHKHRHVFELMTDADTPQRLDGVRLIVNIHYGAHFLTRVSCGLGLS
jgi:hypothetical protein